MTDSPIDSLLPQDTDVLVAADILSAHQYGECHNNHDKGQQCDLLTEDGGHHMDPTRLGYKERLAWHLKEFCYKTSSHGIPMLGQAPNALYRVVWILLLLSCAAMFIFQAVNVVAKYRRLDKITDIQLKFDTAPFPSITLCNLNPYMDSLVHDVESIQKILFVYKQVMREAEAHNTGRSQEALEEETRRRRKRAYAASFEPAHSVCDCDEVECTANVTATPEEMTEPSKMCLCAFDRESGDAWPCYPKGDWVNMTCQFCDQHDYCMRESMEGSKANRLCLCQKHDPFCMGIGPKSKFLDLWEYYGPQNVEEYEKMVEALGFAGMTDEVAIVTKAKENIMFAMSELTEEIRRNISIQKHELIQKCSFNGQACDIQNDFQIITDPTFGNCYMFNHNRSEIKSSLRAGPMYGLRVLVYVNAEDYLPTTEAVGVRLTIHDKEEFPFPDTFGYNAPTGYISSFGINMKQMERLPAPYGDCIMDGKTDNYIYTDYAYSTEGCYRTCFQDMVIRDCGCGDPRFPVLGNASHCYVFDPLPRKCLERRTKELGNIHSSFRCRCQQPCKQSVYSVSYSEAIWPSQSLNITLGTCKLPPGQCNEHYQENGAMLEVFYEALNFEVLTESEAYGVVKMLADFGGQLGLWSGVSFITCCEFVCLGLEVAYMVIMHRYIGYKRDKWIREQEKYDL